MGARGSRRPARIQADRREDCAETSHLSKTGHCRFKTGRYPSFDEAAAILALISSPAGHAINLFDDLMVYRLEDGRYAVSERINAQPDQRPDAESLFVSAQAAAAFFVERRKYRQLGFDYERDAPSPKAD